MSHNEVLVRAVAADRLREARAARAATALIRARRRARRFPRATRKRVW